MKNIAIFASGSGESAQRVVSLFNEGNRIRVKTVVTDRENAEIIETLRPYGITVEFFSREQLHESPSGLISLLRGNDIELIALDEFKSMLPDEISNEYEGRIITLSAPQEAPREVASALRRIYAPIENQEPRQSDRPQSVDEEWAETLKIDFDQSRLRSTPPPIPGKQDSSADVKEQQPASVTYGQTIDPVSGKDPYSGAYGQYAGRSDGNIGEPMPSTYMIWSVLATVFCCFIPGIIAIVFSSQVSSKYLTGDLAGAKRASDRAQVWIIVSFVLGLLSSTLYLPIMMMA